MTPPRWRLALSIQSSLSQASWVGVRIMVGYRAIELGASPFLLALLAASFAVPTIAAALPAGRLSDRVGGSIVAFAGLLVASVGTTAIVILPPEIGVLVAGTLVVGLGHLLVMVGQQTFVAHASRDGSVDSGFGTLAAAASIGQLIGPPAVTLASTLGSPLAPNTTVGLAVCICFTALAFPMIAVLRRGDVQRRRATEPSPRTPLTQVLRAPELWRALAVSGAVLVTVDLLYTFVPLWAVSRDISAVTVGLLLALRAFVSVISRFGLGGLVARFGRRLLILFATVCGVLSLAALPFVDAWGAIPVMVALGVALGIPQPLTMAWTTAITPASAHGAALGLRLTANRIAQVAIPLAVGGLAGPLGITAIFWANAAVLAAGAVIVATSRTIDGSSDDLTS